MRQALAALVCLFLAAHLPYLPTALEDIDSVNFALGVRDFDVARHQPHPPGYPVYVALGKVSTVAFGGAADARALTRGLALWSVLAGAALIPLLVALFRALHAPPPRAWWAMAIAVTSPLFWFTALRPLSDMTGLAAAVAAQALLLRGLTGAEGPRTAQFLGAGGLVAGLAAGIRTQTVFLTLPLLLAVLVVRRPGLTLRARAAAIAAAAAGGLIWGIPLLVESGGVQGYMDRLGSQAGEDFTGVVMLWTTRTPRAAVNAFNYSFLWPWGTLIAGGIVLAAAAVGAVRLLLHERASLAWLLVAFVPYAIFHLLFHETATVRYALPLVVPAAFLAAAALDWAGRRAGMILGGALVAASLVAAAPAARAYGQADAPAIQALRRVAELPASTPLGMHAVFRRTTEAIPPATAAGEPRAALRAPHGREWLALIERWRAEPAASIAFVADPKRTDLSLIDPRGREPIGSYRWSFPELPYVGGVRPGNADAYLLRSPGWILDRGWALSAEIGGVSARDAVGPHVQPSVAWVRARPEPALMMIGGRNLDQSAPTRLAVKNGGATLAEWDAAPGFFFQLVPLPGGSLSSAAAGLIPIAVESSSRQVRVSLEQFDLQTDGVEMFGFVDGWQEPEYNPMTARSWRWMSERAAVWARPIGHDVELTLSGESPLRYYDAPPTLRITAGGQELGRFTPAADFTYRVRVPAALLESAGGRVLVESDRWFVPADRGGSADRRRLALRIYEVGVAPAAGR